MKTPTTPTSGEPKKDRRSPENVVTSFSISRSLLADAKAMAEEDDRPLSYLIQKILEKEILARKKARLKKGGG